ncbi:MAG TPA: hypothetical protein VFA11_09040 [Acidimicrobiales bacterium]|nr:hypothetical protein [Acidimicrobiales bacterium]
MVDIRAFPRSVFERSVDTVRAPVDAVARLIGGGHPASPVRAAIDQADAAVRETVGRLTGDTHLVAEARRRRAAADERHQAARLQAEAEAKRRQADESLAAGKRRAEAQRRRAAEAAERQATAADRTKQQKLAELDQTVSKQRAAQRRAAEVHEKAIHDEERQARLATLEDEEAALAHEEEALSAREEAERLEETAAAVKAARKDS